VNDVVIRVPASSANLGAGFDVLGVALDLCLEVGMGVAPGGARSIDQHHLATAAFVAATGGVDPEQPLWVRSSIPEGRGLGFSGAARVGGAALAAMLGSDEPHAALEAERASILGIVAGLEGHGDNAAASVYGGIVAWVDGRVIRLRVGPQLAAASVVMWIPDDTTSTDRSRSRLPDDVARRDAVHNIGRVAQLVAAVEHDDPTLLDGATDDRLHQAARLAALPGSARALAAGVDAGAWCGWLSGSGPSVGFLSAQPDVEHLCAALPETGRVERFRISDSGVHVRGGPERR
jgi:homoserine kinase